MVVLCRWLSNSSSTPLGRAIAAYRRINLHSPSHAPARASGNRRAIRLTDRQVARMAQRYRDGATLRQLADQFDTSRAAISHRLKDAGVPIRHQGLTEGQVHEATRLYEQGDSLVSVGTKIDACPDTVRRTLIAHGVAMRTRSGERREPQPVDA